MTLTERAEIFRSTIEENLLPPRFRVENGLEVPIHGSNWNGCCTVPIAGSMATLSLYLRDTHYLLRESYSKRHEGSWKRALILASISSDSPGSGVMEDMLLALDAEALRRGCHVIKIENFQNLSLYHYCVARGYSPEPMLGRGLRSVYKLVSSLKETSPDLKDAG